jgi:hypothetical protein
MTLLRRILKTRIRHYGVIMSYIENLGTSLELLGTGVYVYLHLKSVLMNHIY